MWSLRILLLLIFFISPNLMAKNQLVYFEPKHVELIGVIKKLQFAGPPNYESLKNGDKDETGPYLILNNPVDVQLAPKSRSDTDIPEKNVSLLQLVVDHKKDWEKIKEGNFVQINGTLFHAFTGHHHARVLLMIEKVTVISKQRMTNKKIDITDEDKEFLKRE